MTPSPKASPKAASTEVAGPKTTSTKATTGAKSTDPKAAGTKPAPAKADVPKTTGPKPTSTKAVSSKATDPKSAPAKAASPKPASTKVAPAKVASPKPASAKAAVPKAASHKPVSSKAAVPKAASHKPVSSKATGHKGSGPKAIGHKGDVHKVHSQTDGSPKGTKAAGKDILLVTKNPGKIVEYTELLRPLLDKLSLKLLTLDDLKGKFIFPGPQEDGKTFADNASLKAEYWAKHTGLPSLADDSGLCVKALAGAPGVLSARWGDPKLDDHGRCLKLLDDLDLALKKAKSSGDKGILRVGREAYFECALCFIGLSPFYYSVTWKAQLEGTIAEAPSGTGGFGYDSIFIPNGSPFTLAEMPQAEKNRLSHRAKAVEWLLREADLFEEYYDDE